MAAPHQGRDADQDIGQVVEARHRRAECGGHGNRYPAEGRSCGWASLIAAPFWEAAMPGGERRRHGSIGLEHAVRGATSILEQYSHVERVEILAGRSLAGR